METQKKARRVLEQALPSHRIILGHFEQWLREERCMAPASVCSRLQHARDFLRKVADGHDVHEVLGQLRVGDIEAYFVGYANGHAINSRRCMASALRRLLQFGAQRGWNDAALVAAVPPVYSYQLSTVPEGISLASIERVLASLKPDCAVRCRDRGVLLLLATYGPRTGQISDLQLGDVAWRAKEITFCAQKRSRAVRHVLTPAVAEALALYLREHRPHAEHDHVFVRHRGPSSPLTPAGVRGLVAYRLREAGINDGLLSPRAFRYSLATRLLEARHPYKLIADTFGHQSMRATAVYTKMNRPLLEEAAAEWPEPAQ
jgi:integrase